ncbi:NAD(P)-binding protein [Exidia glandulosa HHB12029]|uniref:NAD(P)-binding protein n=1 Tax=Exidia glandulosa HHB12029 TaxID=1314781 RepID=A0A165B1X5_EXIGL|nr:NAD(P)-binding protein [Exidia glandulosa HHB12029]KZV82260.1 NAD(P)-binding protein [Exidia glandulosa HHB12029]KZV83276.1 NAD(P)-binding protein [Exidia glandulosa HHB12029]
MTAHLPRTQSGSVAMSNDVPYSRPASPHQRPPQIGFAGLGSMGYEMATNLALHPHAHPGGTIPPVLVWNRTRAKAEKLVHTVGQGKARIAKDLEQLVTECDVILTSFASDAVVQDVYNQFFAVLKASQTPLTRSKIFVETSTIYPAVAGELDKLASQIPHIHFLSCPVTGAPAAAKSRNLIIFLAGNYLAKKEVAYLLIPSIGRKAVDLGGNVEKAATFKLIGNAFILGQLELMSEAMTLAEKTGVGAENFVEYVKEIFPAPPLLYYAPKLLNDEFDGTKGFAIDGGVKDASHIRRLTGEHNCPMPVIDIAHQHLLTARSVHLGRQIRGDDTFDVLDWSAIVAGSRLAAGLDPFDSSKKSARVVKED